MVKVTENRYPGHNKILMTMLDRNATGLLAACPLIISIITIFDLRLKFNSGKHYTSCSRHQIMDMGLDFMVLHEMSAVVKIHAQK